MIEWKFTQQKQAAEKLQVSYRKVLQLINDGELPAKQIGRDWRITENQLQEYLEGNDKNQE